MTDGQLKEVDENFNGQLCKSGTACMVVWRLIDCQKGQMADDNQQSIAIRMRNWVGLN